MTLTLSQIAERLRGEVHGDGAIEITGLAEAQSAKVGDLTFADNDKFLAAAEQSDASAILISGTFTAAKKPFILVPNARIAIARLLPIFFPPEDFAPGIDPTARVAASAQIDPLAHIGPSCVVGERVRIGARSVLMGGNHIGRDAEIGSDTRLYPNVVIYYRCQIGNRVAIHAGTVIGSDGYGYVFDEGRHRKVLQVGNVVIRDDVEIGANAAIDRAALGSTVVGHGTKIDNLVHVAHNVSIGNHCLVMGQVGFAGSTQLADYCVIASQSGIAGHLKLGRQATVGAKSGVMRDIPDGETVLGIPAQPHREMKRQWIGLQQLPDTIKRLRALEKQIQDLSVKSDHPPA
jgi:UDP-3-O-[3-hydroxymyristoyl] glucosamine N-acyltransferase